MDAESNDSSLVHTKTETQNVDQSQDSKYLLQAPTNKIQDSQLSLLSSMSSRKPVAQQEKMKNFQCENVGVHVMLISTEVDGKVNSSEQIRELFLQNPALQSTYNQSGIVDSSTQQNRSNRSFGISSYKRKKDG